MAKFFSVFLATVQYVFGFYVFKKPDLSGCGPLLSSMVVLLAQFLVLWSLPLYPRKLRKLIWAGNFLAQYIIAVFFIEYLMGCFWFPLETAILALPPKISTSLEELLMLMDVGCNIPCDILKREGTGMFMSYSLSLIILIAAMHATRIINLKLLSCGCGPFLNDLFRRLRKCFKNCLLNIGISTFRPKRSRKRDYCPDDELDFESPSCAPTTDSESYCDYR